MTLEKIYNKWLSIQPLSEADQNKLSMRFTVEYNYNSNHLEGNTLTYGQTELLLLLGQGKWRRTLERLQRHESQ